MNSSEIDEIIKKGLKETEKRSEDFATASKPRVWDAIEMPRRRNGFRLGFVLAMAAAVSLFLVSTILFLKLQSQQRELLALQSTVKPELETDFKEKESAVRIEKTAETANPKETEEPIQPNNINEKAPLNKIRKPKKPIEAEITKPDLEPLPLLATAIVTNPVFEVTETELPKEALVANLETAPDPQEEHPTPSPTKTQTKLRLRFGTGGQSFNSGNSLALHIKL